MKSKLRILVFGILCLSFIPSFAQLNSISAIKIIEKLKAGNDRFVKNKRENQNFPKQREELSKGQHPYCIVLTCSDSRVAPEYIFDEELGKLFVVRTAGNVIDSAAMGSIEYAAEHLHATMLLVLGHESCGAVKASLEGETPSPYINSIIHKIKPAVLTAKSKCKDEKCQMTTAIKENVKNQMRTAVGESAIIKEMAQERKITVVGAVYNLKSGKVEFIEGVPSGKEEPAQHEEEHKE